MPRKGEIELEVKPLTTYTKAAAVAMPRAPITAVVNLIVLVFDIEM